MEVEVKDSSINSFLIEGFSKNIPLIDIFILLTKQVNYINKITFFHEPMNYISNTCKFQVDFANHESLVKAKLILNAQNLNNLFESKGQKIKISECQLNNSNLVNETVSKTKALMFENMQINQLNLLEFIKFLNNYINQNSSEKEKSLYKISKIRQYSNRILVIFEPNVPECLKKFIRIGENESTPPIPYFNYKNKNIPVIPKMKPIVNIGKYKEKNMKLSVYNINEEDRNNLHAIFETKEENDDNNLMLSKMAENAINNILNKDKILREEKLKKNNLSKKRERIHEKSNEKDKDRRDRDRDRDRDREIMNRDKLRDSNRNRDMKNNRIRERDNRREKNRDYNNRNMYDERREDSSSDRDRKRERESNNNNINLNNMNNNNNFRNNNGNNISNINNNNNNNLNNNLTGLNLNINENDLNQVASLFSNAKAVNLVKILLESNAFNNINTKPNLNQNMNNIHNNNNNLGNINQMNNTNIIQNKPQMKLNEESNNNNKNINYNDTLNNMYNQSQNNLNTNVNLQQLLNVLQSQNNQNNLLNNNNKNNQTKQRMNNNNNLNNNFQNLLNMNQLMGMDNNNLINSNNYFNNQRQFQYSLNDQFMNQFNAFSSPQKRKNNDN